MIYFLATEESEIQNKKQLATLVFEKLNKPKKERKNVKV